MPATSADGIGRLQQTAQQPVPVLPPPVSAGCGLQPAQIGVHPQQITISGDGRSYVLAVSPAYQPTMGHALVFGWHGMGLDGTQMRSFMQDIEALAGDQAIFVYPDAGGRAWELDVHGSDVALLDKLVEHLSESYCIDSKRIFSIGFSDGAFFTNFLGQKRAALLRAIAAVSGGGGGGNRMAALVVHGNIDGHDYVPGHANVDFQGGVDSATSWGQSDGCTGQPDVSKLDACQYLAGCPQPYPVVFCPWSGNHDWPRFASANSAIWQFLASFQ